MITHLEPDILECEVKWVFKNHCYFMSLLPVAGAFQVTLVVKNPPANAGDVREVGLIPGLGRSPGYLTVRNPFDIDALLLLLLLLPPPQPLLIRFSRVRLCETPSRAAHRAPPSLGFSRQEHWSGLPFPSPMHESEK